VTHYLRNARNEHLTFRNRTVSHQFRRPREAERRWRRPGTTATGTTK